ncbi:DUF2249 domain-containing protein [Paenibacillus pabuli]|uniref:DUF2249 domain-containing protein n=1 Tax=Paenibacillus pabuli TaxID=1472 RepID=UPI001FFF0C2D|nr:DUF2249 domain-containing protein [Paenibacillus pabuli]UPK41824.1 DUF2249 domain-containing protein [Paenibacillus pabuli]
MPPSDVNIIELDVRPHLKNKLEPFQLIMDTVKGLRPEDVFVLHAPFKPTPLLGILKLKGYSHSSERMSSDHWITTFVHKRNKTNANAASATNSSVSDPDGNALSCMGRPKESEDSSFAVEGDERLKEPTVMLDNRGLEPPQPMMRTLAALKRCKPGDEIVIHNDRVPVFLIEELISLGCPYTIEDQADGTAKVRIKKG